MKKLKIFDEDFFNINSSIVSYYSEKGILCVYEDILEF